MSSLVLILKARIAELEGSFDLACRHAASQQKAFTDLQAEKDAEIASKDAQISTLESAADSALAGFALKIAYRNERIAELELRNANTQSQFEELAANTAGRVSELESALAAQGAGEPVAYQVEAGFWQKFESIPQDLRNEAIPLYTGRPPAPEQASPLTRMIELRTSDGWKLNGELAPLLYTDLINGEQVCRDDLWIAATSALKQQAAPEQAEAVRKDAERYRWLRHWHEHVYAVDADGDLILKHHGVGIAGESAERFDAAIDAALAAGEQG